MEVYGRPLQCLDALLPRPYLTICRGDSLFLYLSVLLLSSFFLAWMRSLSSLPRRLSKENESAQEAVRRLDNEGKKAAEAAEAELSRLNPQKQRHLLDAARMQVMLYVWPVCL